MRETIEGQPLYQRGEVWTRDKQQLLIDSILRELDVPKIYLRLLRDNAVYSHQIVDGQQRLNAIWRFTGPDEESYPLHHGADVPNDWAGKRFNELDDRLKKRILDFEIVIAEIQAASDNEVRELFARLQKGMQLNPAELRNSIASKIGGEIRAMAQNHPFFAASPFSPRRYKHHDLAAHAFAIELNGVNSNRDLKAPDLREMYVTHSDVVPRDLAKNTHKNLGYLHEMLKAVPGCVSRKWGFVDVYSVVSRNVKSRPSPAVLAKRYSRFEQERLKHVGNPESLLATGSTKSRELYDYIIAFKLSAGESRQLNTRYEILARRLIPRSTKP